jgi:glycosyltransferase involved in cell wall biosynthesis
MLNIGFIYTKYYPLSSSASVHGYQLVNGLVRRGYGINSLEQDGNPLTNKFSRNPRGVVSLAANSDLLYIRINPFLINDTLTLSKMLTRKKVPVIWEINAPIEELEADYYPNIPAHVQKLIAKQNKKRKFLAKYCDASVCVSTVLRDYAIKDLNIANSVFVPNGSDPELFKPTPKDEQNPLYPYLKDKFVVAWAGNAKFVWQGIEVIKKVAAEMAKIDKDVVFLVISNTSFYNESILPNVISLAEINYLKLPQFLNMADVALCPYESYDWCKYGFYNSPLKMFDFMSMELPTIGTRMGQIEEVLVDGVDGYLTDNSVDDIVQKILVLKNDEAKRKEMGRNARRKIIEKYSWDHGVGQIDTLIQKVVQGK